MRADPLSKARRRSLVPSLAAALVAGAALSIASPAPARATPAQLRVEDTAYTLPAGGFSVGLWSAEAGILQHITIGTYLPAWLAFPLVDAPILTGFIKLRAPWDGPLAIAVRVGAVYFDASTLAVEISDGRATRANVLAVPFELAASLRISDAVTQSLTLDYVTFSLGASEQDNATGAGSARTAHASLSALLELRLASGLALTLTGRVSVFQSAARIRAHLQRGPTSLNAELGFRPFDGKLPWCVVPGVALQWGGVHLQLGLGYGSYWLPIVHAPLPSTSIVPEGNFYVRF